MIYLIAQREWCELWRDRRLVVAGGLVTVLMCASLAVGWQRQQEIASERRAAQVLDYDDWVAQQQRHPHDAAHQGMHVFKPEPPLSIIDPGIEPYVGSTIWLQAHRQSELKFRPAQDATGLQRFGSLSVAWVLQMLGPLLVIVLGFNAFATEREQGTLRQVLSLGVSPRQLLWGKATALGSALAVLAAPAMAIAVVAIVIAGSAAAETWSVLARLGWLTAAYALYLGLWIFVVLGVSARVRTARASMTTLIALWILTAILAPRVIADVARKWQPTPSRTEFDRALNQDLNAAYAQEWQEHFGTTVRWGPDLPFEKWGISLQVDDHAGYAVTDKHFGALWDTFAAQRRFQEWAGVFVPMLAIRSFSMGLSGTDFAHHRDFSVAAETHRRVMQDLMSGDLVAHADPLKDRHFAYQAQTDLWARVPRFAYATPSVSFALRESWRGLAALALTAGVAIVAVLAAVPRRRLL